ncbi:MAG: molybdopterin-guanine dinucleotide biosynthesis protein B [Alkalicoccus sp.]|nr:MAG: molybdopterin-guanine dinucleotide biosynthesis protein B [Alkalicoccus sp.]
MSGAGKGADVRVFQVAGWSNTGKTTLTKMLVRWAAEKGFRTAAVKHHGKNVPLYLDSGSTDTAEHRRAGAEASVLTGSGETQINIDRALPLDSLLEIYAILGIELVIVEGFKYETYPKVVTLREAEDAETLTNVTATVGPAALKPDFTWEEAETNIDRLGGLLWNKGTIITSPKNRSTRHL